MGHKNRLFTFTLIALTLVAGGSGLTYFIERTVRSATLTISGHLQEIAGSQKKMEATLLTAGKAASSAWEARLTALESEVKAIKTQLAAMSGPPPEDMNKVYDLPVANSYLLGPQDAPLTITVFQDYQCPFSAKFYPQAIASQKAFPDQVRILVKHYPLPFHDKARQAAKAAMAAGEQGKFYEMSDLILANAEMLNNDKFTELAQKAGLNVARFQKDLKDKDATYEKIIESDLELGSKVDVMGTPTFFLNGKKSASRTADAWKAEIEAVLKK